MDTSNLLKQEVNQTLEDLHDFAKWKLIAVSSLAAAGLGLSKSEPQMPYWLLMFVPYACAYVDLNCYQYLLRILLIAKVLRRTQDDALLYQYEEQCEIYRKKGFFGLGIFAQLGSSLTFSAILPGFTLVRIAHDGTNIWLFVSALVAWLIGILLLFLCYRSFIKKSMLLDDNDLLPEKNLPDQTVTNFFFFKR